MEKFKFEFDTKTIDILLDAVQMYNRVVEKAVDDMPKSMHNAIDKGVARLDILEDLQLAFEGALSKAGKTEEENEEIIEAVRKATLADWNERLEQQAVKCEDLKGEIAKKIVPKKKKK